MLARDGALFGVDERSTADDVLSSDHEAVDAMRGREHEAGHEVLGAAQLEDVRSPHGKVGAFPGLERADVVAAEDSGASARREPERVTGGHLFRSVAAARDEERLIHLDA